MLHLAIQRKHGAGAAFLVHRGADLNHVNVSGQTPLHLAAESDDLSLLVELMLRNKANPNLQTKLAATAADDLPTRTEKVKRTKKVRVKKEKKTTAKVAAPKKKAKPPSDNPFDDDEEEDEGAEEEKTGQESEYEEVEVEEEVDVEVKDAPVYGETPLHVAIRLVLNVSC